MGATRDNGAHCLVRNCGKRLDQKENAGGRRHDFPYPPDLQKLIDRGQGDTPLLELPHIRRLTG